MDLERPHRSKSSSSSSNATSTTSELFICFTSRLSSSSMKLSSKSILSPGCPARRLKTNGSMKGGQASPMFPTDGKKRGCSFENPEPSSPKVTCIGQVRVKTKKQGRKFRACGSMRGGEVSFRKVEAVNNGGFETSGCQGHVLSGNKKWVHLPMSICEALRAFGAEFNCFLPCRSSCMANHRDKEEKARGSACARWLVAVQEGGEEGKGKGIELVVGGGQRRHVFEDIVINDFGNKNVGDEDGKGGGEAGRVSICIPPKNALLLMRCRSDPVKMAALANKICETPLPKDKQQQQQQEEHEEEEEDDDDENGSEENEGQEDDDVEVEREDQQESKEGTFTLPQDSFDEKLLVEELQPNENGGVEAEEEEEGSSSSSTMEEEETETTQERSESECPEMREPDQENESKEGQEKVLPDCLLLMRCEPKLSMEVSKETWVCSTDFIRFVPDKKKNQQQQSEVKQEDGGDQSKARINVDRDPAPILLHPPRSSCSFPAAPPMAKAAAAGGGNGTMIDKKLVGGKGYESFILTRCKSEPRRFSAKLAPDACFWENRKLEPAALRVATARVGF